MSAPTDSPNLGPNFVKDRETGRVYPFEADEEYFEAIRVFNDAECTHPNMAPMRIVISGGALQVRPCCAFCGHKGGQSLKQTDKAWVDSLPILPADTLSDYEAHRSYERYEIKLTAAKRQFQERGRFTKFYKDYMASEGWQEKRRLVLNRCRNICEGCGLSDATEVHHRSYEHLGSEFLWELAGLCHPCHDRLSEESRIRLGFQDDFPDDEDQ